MKSRHSLLHSLIISSLCLFGFALQGQICSNSTVFNAFDNSREARICPNDGIDDFVVLSKLDSSQGAMYSFIIADVRDNIIDVTKDSILNFEGTEEGITRIWGISHSDSLIYREGFDVITVRSRTGCATLSDNVVNIIKDSPAGGIVELLSGLQDSTFCALNTNTRDTTITVFSSSLSGLNYTFILTSETNRIISSDASGTFDFSDLFPGTYFIYGLSFDGDPNYNFPADTSLIGLVNQVDFCGELSNAVTINKELPVGGLVRTSTLDTFAVVCPEGNEAQVLLRNTGSNTFPYAYIITDEGGKILGISLSDTVDFSGAPPGLCLVYGLSYEGEILATEGDSIQSTQLVDDCYDLSSSVVRVIRVLAEAGTISAINEGNELLSCPGDNLPDRFIFERDGATPELPSRYIITDLTNVVLQVSNINVLDFEGSPEGECKIYSTTFSGNLLIDVGDTLFVHPVSSGCFDITENHLTIRRFVPDGGDVFVTTGESTLFLCEDQMGSTTIRLANNSLKPQKYNYVITNSANQIIEVIEQNTYSFTELPRGSSRIWGVAYTGNRLLVNGDNLSFSSFSDACFDLSNNFLEIISDQVFAGQISLANGSKSHFFCLGSDEPTEVQYEVSNQSNSKYQFVLTDFNNRIIQFLDELGFDFKSIGAGSYRIWGVSYTGDPIIKVNDNLLELPFSDDCYDVTTEPISVIRDNPFAGQLLTTRGLGKAYTCPINDDLDFVKFEPRDAVYLKYAFVVTDTLETIINFSFIDSIDFGLAPIGICRVYGVSFEGEFTARVGNQLRNIAYSDECWDLSNNYVEIIRTSPVNHNVFTSNGESSAMVCVGDGGADEIAFTTDDQSGIPKAYVATDLDDNILSSSITSTLNFENAPTGTCRVFSVSYTGQFIATPGTNIHSAQLGDDCFVVSENHVTVERVDSGPLCLVSQQRIDSNSSFFKISPNPAAVHINIAKTDIGIQKGINRIQVYSVEGQHLLTTHFNDRSTSLSVDEFYGLVIIKLSNTVGETWIEKVAIIR